MLMVVVTYILLAWFGLAFGSFVNALVWRLHEQSTRKKSKKKDLSIINGRSVCPHCRHQLAWYDLLPVVSWLWLRGKCRYCKKPISAQYPAVELALALVFTFSYAFWPADVTGWQWALFAAWLLSAVGLMALLVYDMRWMLLPNKIIYPTLLVATVGRLIYILGAEPRKLHALAFWGLAVVVSSGIFWVLFTISKGKWIGYGDVRLGLITGTLLATPAKSFLMIFIASAMGVIVIIPALALGKKTLASKIPYGPFLITSTAVCVLFGQSIVDWYQRIFLL
jgi:prepilin signal peptidase PulO-like enzyme (type II secretory pathway)